MSDYTYSTQPPPPPGHPSSGGGWGMPNSGDTNSGQDWRGSNTNTSGYHHHQHNNNNNNGVGGMTMPPTTATTTTATTMSSRPQPPAVEPNPNLYIHNVPKDATEEELKDLFSTFGTVERIRLKVNQKIGPQALYAFVTFNSTSEAQLALQRLNGYDMRSRRLRIEFQRSREEDSRPSQTHSHEGGGYDNRTGGGRGSVSVNNRNRDFGNGVTNLSGTNRTTNLDRRKRNGFESPSYMDETGTGGYNSALPRDSVEVGSAFKKARHFDQTPFHSSHAVDGLYSNRKPHDFVEDNWSNTNITQGPPAEPITISLCDLLRNVRPDIFFELAQTLMTTPVTASATQQQPARAKSGVVLEPSSIGSHPSYISPPHQTLPPASESRPPTPQRQEQPPAPYPPPPPPPPQVVTPSMGSVIWRGNLVRNSRKKVPIEVCYINGGPMEKFLSSDIVLLNISHRSSWDDLMKKSIAAVCYLKQSETEILDSGTTVPLTAQKAESCQKFLAEHLQYLTAGVVALPNGNHLYLIPPGTPLFDKFKSPEMPQSGLIMLGLFATAPLPPVASSVTTNTFTQPENLAVIQPTTTMNIQSTPEPPPSSTFTVRAPPQQIQIPTSEKYTSMQHVQSYNPTTNATSHDNVTSATQPLGKQQFMPFAQQQSQQQFLQQPSTTTYHSQQLYGNTSRPISSNAPTTGPPPPTGNALADLLANFLPRS